MILSEGNRKSTVFTCFKWMDTFPSNVWLFKCSLIPTATRLAKQHLHWVSWIWMIVFCIRYNSVIEETASTSSIGEKTLHKPNSSGSSNKWTLSGLEKCVRNWSWPLTGDVKIHSLYGSWEKQGFVMGATSRAVCLWDRLLEELPLYTKV